MKSKHMALFLLTTSIFSFVPSCGSNDVDSDAKNSQVQTDEFNEIFFHDGSIGFNVKNKWSCEEEKNELTVTCLEDNSFFKVVSYESGYDMYDYELEKIYNKMAESHTDISTLSKRNDCDVYFFSFYSESYKCKMHMYYFTKNGVVYSIMLQEKGEIFENMDKILTPIFENMILIRKLNEQGMNWNDINPHP